MLYNSIVILFIIVGIIFIIFSFTMSRYDHFVETEEEARKTALLDKKIDYDEVTQKIIDLNEYGEFLKEDIEKKHKELLFVYQLLTEKEKHIKTLIDKFESLEVELKQQYPLLDIEESVIEESQEEMAVTIEERNRKVLDMASQGMSRMKIAKALNIGVGQVELILNIYK